MGKHQEFALWLQEQIKNDQEYVLTASTDSTSGRYLAMGVRTIKILQHFETHFKDEIANENNSHTSVNFTGSVSTEPEY